MTTSRRSSGHIQGAALAAEDPTNETGAAHAVKERLRLLLWEHEPHVIRRRLFDFYDAPTRAEMTTTRLAKAIETWWPARLAATTEDVTNAPTEGFNRIIKQTKRVGCGSTNMDNYRRRIMVHIALTRGQNQLHEISARPAQVRRARLAGLEVRSCEDAAGRRNPEHRSRRSLRQANEPPAEETLRSLRETGFEVPSTR